MSLTLNVPILRPYLRDTFIETGTFKGGGIDVALAAGAKRVISIEVHEPYWRAQVERFKGDPRVRIILGDSAVALGPVVAALTESAVFWLDGHAHLDGHGELKSPIIQELQQIQDAGRKDHVILIDDYYAMGTDAWGGVTIAEIRDALLAINGDYVIDVIANLESREGILVAVPPKGA